VDTTGFGIELFWVIVTAATILVVVGAIVGAIAAVAWLVRRIVSNRRRDEEIATLLAQTTVPGHPERPRPRRD
jgi:type IV secretory pathway VirB3-like protein